VGVGWGGKGEIRLVMKTNNHNYYYFSSSNVDPASMSLERHEYRQFCPAINSHKHDVKWDF